MAVAGAALAQDYPTRPIRALTTTSAAESATSSCALGDELLSVGQPIVVEIVPVACRIWARRACTEAPPDAIPSASSTRSRLRTISFLLKNMPFDPERGLQRHELYHLIQTLVVNSQLNVKTMMT